MQDFQQEPNVPTPYPFDVPRGAPIKLKQANFYEFSLWPDGSIIIEHRFEPAFTKLSAQEARALRNFLNSGDVRAGLGIALDCPPYRPATPLQGKEGNAQ
ncbi:hypothetical protein [Dictyobacter kobayashii]|uniref:Uncharacterized protein n=1 Tax=Dictyobacter kobayashii TaxID=2014872 RepID=A0A402AIR6_9CHLR|nr:hypothetical protein [Dictyobacter kobayashii]GCE18954.1 hypothetical protein KDK_27540 [Dictyobacter kobayashii]